MDIGHLPMRTISPVSGRDFRWERMRGSAKATYVGSANLRGVVRGALAPALIGKGS
jgi:hypothetical protein